MRSIAGKFLILGAVLAVSDLLHPPKNLNAQALEWQALEWHALEWQVLAWQRRETQESNSVDPLFRSSITATDFDFITEDDPSAFESISFLSEGQHEMPDKRSDAASLLQNAYVFAVEFSDGTATTIYIDADFKDRTAALAEAKRYVHPLGKLPTALRKGVKRLVVHQGGEDTTAFSDIGLIVLYSDNATKRISTHDLEETVFHESVHATWDPQHAGSKDWERAQAADGAFVTVYGEKNPRREDLAESAIFAFALLHHPDRIPDTVKSKIREVIPNRTTFRICYPSASR